MHQDALLKYFCPREENTTDYNYDQSLCTKRILKKLAPLTKHTTFGLSPSHLVLLFFA